MPQVIAGTASDLTKTVSQLVMELLQSNWPTSTFDPLASEVGFGLDQWDNYGDIDIHVNAAPGTSIPDTIGWGRSRVEDPVLIRLFVRKNQENQIPSNMGNAQRKIEEIIKDNAATLGQGITMLRWDGWGPVIVENNLTDVWQIAGKATAIYFKVKV